MSLSSLVTDVRSDQAAPSGDRQPISVTIADTIMWLTFMRPEIGNALNANAVEELHLAFDRAEREQVKAVVFQGDGPHFCTGFDLTDISNSSNGDLLHRFIRIEQLLQRCYEAPFLTVAFAQGRTYGAGADLFVACDHRIVAEDTHISFPGAAFGILLGTRRLMERVGKEIGRSLIRSGQTINATTARSLGVATDAFPHLHLTDMVNQWIKTKLDQQTVTALHRIGNSDISDASLTDLVRSASRPGLKLRIESYVAEIKALQNLKRGEPS